MGALLTGIIYARRWRGAGRHLPIKKYGLNQPPHREALGAMSEAAAALGRRIFIKRHRLRADG